MIEKHVSVIKSLEKQIKEHGEIIEHMRKEISNQGIILAQHMAFFEMLNNIIEQQKEKSKIEITKS